MRIFRTLACVCAVASCVEAEAFWPFDSDDSDEEVEVRVSELIEPASVLIDTASDLAATGAVQEAIATYRRALESLKNVERAQPERAKTAEFSTVRNKRAYVEAAITSLQFEETRRHSKPVAVSDTTELERKLAQERGVKVEKAPKAPIAKTAAADERKRPEQATSRTRARQKTLELLSSGRLKEADRLSLALYEQNKDDVMALNLRAAVLAATDHAADAVALLDRAIAIAPSDYVAYYNMARLLMQLSPENKETARGYFADGCALGGPKNAKLEALLK